MNNKNIRINSLTDGVFAIIMTLLVLDVKVPEFIFTPTSNQLSRAVWQLLPDMASFFISFVLLATYWMAHNYIFSSYIKKTDRLLNYLNMVFLMTVSFVPFSSHLLGSYPETNFAISFYAVNIIIIGTTLYILRQYLLNRPYLLQDSIDSKDIIHGTVRIFLPPVFAAIAVVVSYFNIPMSYILLTFPFVFNILPGGLNYLEYKLIHRPRIFINPNDNSKIHRPKASNS
ncbi:MAG: DUF1211 domain-containing protein [Thermales bacterium]|nr:DUF1211 domain-containing protein [Thermales bacterium]